MIEINGIRWVDSPSQRIEFLDWIESSFNDSITYSMPICEVQEFLMHSMDNPIVQDMMVQVDNLLEQFPDEYVYFWKEDVHGIQVYVNEQFENPIDDDWYMTSYCGYFRINDC